MSKYFFRKLHFSSFPFAFHLFFRNFASKPGEVTPSRKKKQTSCFVLLSTFRNFAPA